MARNSGTGGDLPFMASRADLSCLSLPTKKSKTKDDAVVLRASGFTVSDLRRTPALPAPRVIASAEVPGTPPTLPEAEIRSSWLLHKLLCGWTKSTTEGAAGHAGYKINWKRWYDIMREYYASAEPADIPLTELPAKALSGAFVTKLDRCFQYMLSWYERAHRWDFADAAQDAWAVVFWDGRQVWGENEVVALVFKHVLQMQSPDNVWPLAMVKWEGAETPDKMESLFQVLGLKDFIKRMDGTTVSIDGIRRTLRFLVITDWMAMLALFPGAAKPNATVTMDGADPHICPLCRFHASDKSSLKVDGWKTNPTKVWHRFPADDTAFQFLGSLLGLSPSAHVWELLHLITRVLDSALELVVPELGLEAQDVFSGLFLDEVGRKWSSTNALILKNVCHSPLISLFLIAHIHLNI